MNFVSENEACFAYFGYGSLVNRNTLPPDIITAIPTTLMRWRRHWQPRPNADGEADELKDIALLSVHRDDNYQIEGLLIVDRLKNLENLNKREKNYRAVSLGLEDFRFEPGLNFTPPQKSICIYVAHAAQGRGDNCSILQSYLDVVLEGYLREFGEQGIRRFLESTDNFHSPLYYDRQKPVYARHQKIASSHTRLFDKILCAHTGAIN